MMWYLETDFEGFLKVLGSSKSEKLQEFSQTSRIPQERLSPRRLRLIWENNPKSYAALPNLIVTASGEVRSVLAWTSTYVDGYRPLTALCRVIDLETLARCCDVHPSPAQSQFGPACAALSFAEALSNGRGRVDASTVTIASCESTYSFCRSKSLAAGLAGNDNWLIRKWRHARVLTKQPDRFPQPEEVENIWRVLSDVVGVSDHETLYDSVPELSGLSRACRMLITDGAIPVEALAQIAKGRIDIRRIMSAMTETREERVGAFEDMLRVTNDRRNSPDSDFLCGYLASRLNPGSFEYIKLVASHLDSHPALLLWYALFEALNPDTKVLSQFGGLCRRILRDISTSDELIATPNADISLEELEVLLASPAGMEHLRTGSQSTIRLELHPFITMSLRLSPIASTESTSLFHSPEVEMWTQQLGRAIENLNSVFERQGNHFIGEEEDQHGQLRKKRGRKK